MSASARGGLASGLAGGISHRAMPALMPPSCYASPSLYSRLTAAVAAQRRFCSSSGCEMERRPSGSRRGAEFPLDTSMVDILQKGSSDITSMTSVVETALKCERGAKSAWGMVKGVHDAVRGKGEYAHAGTPYTQDNGTTSPRGTSVDGVDVLSRTSATSTPPKSHASATMDTILGDDAPSDGLNNDAMPKTARQPISSKSPLPGGVSSKRFAIKSVRLGDDYLPLSTYHPAFHLFEASPQSVVQERSFWANRKTKKGDGVTDVALAQSIYETRARRLLKRRKTKPPLSTAHPVFGAPPQAMPHELFSGPVYISGFFLAVDPNFAYSARDTMNPNCRLTIRDKDGNFSRARYKCILESDAGFKMEAIIRLQVGWISPHAVFSELPTVIALGKGFDISIPGIVQFTMVNILDEAGCSTGACLYLSGTPTLGFSLVLTNIVRGRLVLNPTHEMDPSDEKYHFFTSHRIHYRQFGFLLMKLLSWGFCILLALPMLDVPNRIRQHVRDGIAEPYSGYLLWVIGQPRSMKEEVNPVSS